MDIVDDRGRRYHIELIEPIQEAGHAQTWKKWQEYRRENAEKFAMIDKLILDDHIVVAETWQ